MTKSKNMHNWCFRDYTTGKSFVLIAPTKEDAIHIAHNLFKEPQVEADVSYYMTASGGFDIYAPEGYENCDVCKEARKNGAVVKAYSETTGTGYVGIDRNWIPVAERLPEETILEDGYHDPSGYVLVQMRRGTMYVSRYWSRYESKWPDLPPTTDEVVAWMPLPKPYKKKGETK